MRIAAIEKTFYNLSTTIQFTRGGSDELLDKAVQTQLENIQKKTGKSFDELAEIVHKSGLTRHGEIREYLKHELGLGHGDANAVVHAVLKSDGKRAAEVNLTDAKEVDPELIGWLKSVYEGAA